MVYIAIFNTVHIVPLVRLRSPNAQPALMDPSPGSHNVFYVPLALLGAQWGQTNLVNVWLAHKAAMLRVRVWPHAATVEAVHSTMSLVCIYT